MAPEKKVRKTCRKGHQFYKSRSCPICPVCEAERKPQRGFLSNVVAPARRALERKGITTLTKLSRYTERQILDLHGLGPVTIPKLKRELKKGGMSFKKK